MYIYICLVFILTMYKMLFSQISFHYNVQKYFTFYNFVGM